jgi:hypothetical protein
MRPTALALAALLSLAGCARPEPPDAAYRQLVAALRARDGDRAWELLSARTQAWLDARAKAAAARAPGVVPASAKELLVGSAALSLRPPKSIVVLRESADRAVLQVAEEGEPPREITMVREGGWRADLPEP